MTQPGFTPLETLYTRALRLLGVSSPGGKQLFSSLSVQPVQIVSDVSDASVPHSNPIYGGRLIGTAQLALNTMVTLRATSRLVRVRQLYIESGTDPTIAVSDVDPMVTVDGTIGPQSLGPFGGAAINLASTTIIRHGTRADAVPVAGGFQPELVQFDVRPPLLIAPGSYFIVMERNQNVAVTVNVIWEEIAPQEATANLGFPA